MERGNTHSCSRVPPIPRGFSTLWLGPATKPSSDIDILTRSLDTAFLPQRLLAFGTHYARFFRSARAFAMFCLTLSFTILEIKR